ncbi:MAG: protein-glutamine glutaminase family protein [Cytophagales bacterium]
MLNYEFPIDDISGLKTYEYGDVKIIFDQISHHSSLEFNFPQGGCQQRSHLISMILAKSNIEHCKIWLFSPAALYDFDQRSLFVADTNQLSPDNIIYWNYHTAPLVKIQLGDKVEKFVIDPSLNREQPLTIIDWLKCMGNSEICKYTFLLPEKYFFNCKYNDNSQLTNVFDGSFFEYVNPAKDNLVLEKGLAVNDMAMIIYHKYIKPLMYNGNANESVRLFDLKEIFGNATALDLIFSLNLSGNTDNTSLRYVMAKYGDIVNEAKQIFNEKLLYWTRFTNKLLSDSNM